MGKRKSKFGQGLALIVHILVLTAYFVNKLCILPPEEFSLLPSKGPTLCMHIQDAWQVELTKGVWVCTHIDCENNQCVQQQSRYSVCACISEVYTSFSDGQRDCTHPECTNYDTNINHHNLSLVRLPWHYSLVHKTTCPLLPDNSLYDELRKASITANTAVTVSVTL